MVSTRLTVLQSRGKALIFTWFIDRLDSDNGAKVWIEMAQSCHNCSPRECAFVVFWSLGRHIGIIKNSF